MDSVIVGDVSVSEFGHVPPASFDGPGVALDRPNGIVRLVTDHEISPEESMEGLIDTASRMEAQRAIRDGNNLPLGGYGFRDVAGILALVAAFVTLAFAGVNAYRARS